MKILIIWKGSKEQGLGHLFRTKAFANLASFDNDVEVIAIIQEELKCIFQEINCCVHFVKKDKQALSYINKFSPDILAFDLLSIDNRVFLYCKENIKTIISISPIFEHMNSIDMLFTRSSVVPKIQGVKICSGLRYSIFGDHIENISDRKYRENISRPELSIAICMGGADAKNKTLLVLNTLLKYSSSLTIWVLLGEGYAHSYDELVSTVRANPQHEIILAKTVRSMWRVLGNCSLAILTGGLTTTEAVYAGLPTINLFEKKEYVNVISPEFFKKGACINGGLLSDNSLKKMNRLLKKIDNNRGLLWKMHRHCKGLLDQKGSERVLKKIKEFIKHANK